MFCDHNKNLGITPSSAATATATAGFGFGHVGESGLVGLWLLARNEPTDGSEGRSFAHPMLSQ